MNDKWLSTYVKSKQFIAALPEEILPRGLAASPIEFDDFVVPFSLYRGTRDNIERIIDQINLSYHYGIADACAVLMRRLVEVLLILCFLHHNIADEIRDGRDYVSLQRIIQKAKESTVLDLDRSTKDDLDLFKDMGDFSAHRRFYNARLDMIERHQFRFEALVQVLLRIAGIIS